MSGATNGHELLWENIPSRVRISFWEKVRKSRRCWEWVRAKNPQGYGIVGWKGEDGFEVHTAHRISFVLAYGAIPAGKVVRSKCGNRGCVRPDHLELTDHLRNVRESLKHRNVGTLSMALATEIRERARAGESDRDLARDYEVRKTRIQRVRMNKIWHDPDYEPVRRNQNHPGIKLTADVVREARTRAAAGEPTGVLAEDYGVAYSTMFDALQGRTWAHVDP